MQRRRRRMITLAALGAVTGPSLAPARQGPAQAGSPALLTLSGAIGKTNRGPLDPALDQLMHKQKVRFEKACSFDFQALAAMPGITMRPTLEYDQKPHTLSGPRLIDVVQAAGVPPGATASLVLRAIDGYAVTLPLQQARRQGFIVATHLDGQPMPLGGLGPLWAVLDADRVPETASKPLHERFALCPWGLYHLEVHRP